MSNRQLLLDLTYKKARERYGDPLPQYVIDRIELEMKTIDKLGRHDYFLIVADLFDFCNSEERVREFCIENDLEIPRYGTIPITPFGRGSAGGSMILGLTTDLDFDPVEYNLFFERFLNIERISEPDVDIDISQEYRQYAILYWQKKFGNVCQISTYGTLSKKNVIADVLRTFNVPLHYVNALKKTVSDDPQQKLADFIDTEEFKNVFYQIPDIDHEFVLNCFTRLEGLKKNHSKHAGGIVMSTKKIEDYIPVWHDGESMVMSAEMKECEAIGFLKLDLLGLRTIDVVFNCEKATGISHRDIPLDDKKAFELVRSGDTAGIFQIEGTGFTQMMQSLEVDEFNDYIMGVSLYRPGTLDAEFEGKTMTDHIIDRKTGREPVSYLFAEEEAYLKDTYGCMLYQEQVMARVRQMTGCSYGHADIVRRAMGKKSKELMKEQMDWFRGEAMSHRFTESPFWNDINWRTATVDRAVVEIEANCRYSFNKAHATSYGGICYNNTYFKANKPLYFYSCLLNTITDPDKMEYILNDIKKHGINIVSPDINKSEKDFTVIGDSVGFGLGAIKGLKSAVQKIINERSENGEYKSVMDFCLRLTGTQINKSGIVALAKAGAFDNICDYNRNTLLKNIEEICKVRSNLQKKRKRKAGDYIPTVEENLRKLASGDKSTIVNIEHVEYDKIEACLLEKEVLGYYISANPIDKYETEINRYTDDHIVGFVTNVHTTSIKKEGRNFGKTMAFITVQTRNENIEITLFPDVWEDCKQHCTNGNVVVTRCNVSEYKGNPSYSAMYVRTLSNTGIRNIKEIHLYVDEPSNDLISIKDTFTKGKTVVFMHIRRGEADVVLRCKDTIMVNDAVLDAMTKAGVVYYGEV